jgi:hypothetical protein
MAGRVGGAIASPKNHMKLNLYTFNTPRFTVKVDARIKDQESLCMQSPLCFDAECSITFHTHTMGAELDAAVQTIEWPYGLGEKFTGDVAKAVGHIVRNSDAEGGSFILVKRKDFDTFTTLELYEEIETECYSGNDYPYKNAVRTDHQFIGRIYCDKLPA